MIYHGKKITLQAHADNIVELCFDAQDASVNVFNDAGACLARLLISQSVARL